MYGKYDFFNENYKKIDSAIYRFNTTKSVNRQNIFTIIQNYKISIFEASHQIISEDSQAQYEMITEIDQVRKKSLVDFPNFVSGFNVKMNGKIIHSTESYQGALKIPTNVNI